MREGSCDKRNTVVKEGNTINVLCDTVSFKTVRLRVVRAGFRVVCDSCERSVSAAQGLLISDFDQLRVTQDQSKCAGCLMTAGTGVWASHECDKTGQLRKDCSVCKKRVDEKENTPKGERVETNAVVQGSMVESWEYDDERNAGVQRRETHSCTDRGASRSACQFGYMSELTTRITTPPRFPIYGSSFEQCGYKKAHWRKRDLVGDRLLSLVRVTAI